MAKTKKNNKLLNLLALLGGLLGIAAVCMGFLTFISVTGKIAGFSKELGTLTGFNAAFGASAAASDGAAWAVFADGTSDGNITLAAKTGITILMILISAGAILTILGALFKSKLGKLILGVGALAMIAGGVMAFFSINLCDFASAGSEMAGYEYSLGIGAILAGVFGCLGGAFGSLSATLQLVK